MKLPSQFPCAHPSWPLGPKLMACHSPLMPYAVGADAVPVVDLANLAVARTGPVRTARNPSPLESSPMTVAAPKQAACASGGQQVSNGTSSSCAARCDERVADRPEKTTGNNLKCFMWPPVWTPERQRTEPTASALIDQRAIPGSPQVMSYPLRAAKLLRSSPGDPVAAQAAQPRGSGGAQILAVELDPSVHHAARRIDQADQRKPGDGLARPAFADQPQDLAPAG